MTDRPDVPAELADLDDDALAALIESLTAEFDRLLDEGSRDVAAMTALADDLDRVNGELTAREAAVAEADAAIAALTERVRATDVSPEEEEGEPAEGEEDETEEEAPAEARQPVLAAAGASTTNRSTRPALGDVARRAPRPRVDQRRTPQVTITAAVDLPGVRPGSNIDLTQVGQSMHDRARSLSDDGKRAPVARVSIPHTHMLGTDPNANVTAIDDLVGQPTAAALVASGGWCAPSVPIFDLFDIGPDASNVFDLPSLGTDVRAGVMLPSFYGIGDAAGALWTWTEATDVSAGSAGSTIASGADAGNTATINTTAPHGLSPGSQVVIAGATPATVNGTYTVQTVVDADTFTITTSGVTDGAITGGTFSARKGCLKIPCPTFTECRMEAEGLCVTHGNLSDRAWPELTRQFLSIVMAAHQRRLSAAKIAKVVSTATAVTPDASMLVSDAAADLLNVLELAAADMRSQYRLSDSRSVDVLLPDWAKAVLRNNMAMRHGMAEMAVTDGQITSWLSSRGIRAQFTPDWQPLYNATPATRWPANITFVIWFSGAYISIDGGSIDLGVVRDSTLNATNDFTAAWSEQFYQVCRRGPLARSYTLALSVDGKTACCP